MEECGSKEIKKQIISKLKSINYESNSNANCGKDCNCLEKEKMALYIHIPFCEKKCNYCSFVSFCNKADKIDLYLDCLIKEMQLRKINDCELKSVYIGGGTPSILSCEQVTKLFDAIRENFSICKGAEITIEINPNSATQAKLECYKNVGINRISVGVQSLSNKELKILGRLHDKQKALECLKLVKECGFNNISCDLMFGLKGMELQNLNRSIKTLKKYLTHFSIYSLMIEENTPFFVDYNNGNLKVLNESQSAKKYLKIVKALNKNGYKRYEVSNFAKSGFESVHNKAYWELDNYLGLGVASHSFINGERMANTEDLDKYITTLSNEKLCYSSEFVSEENLKEEFIMLALRESSGIDLDRYKKMFNADLLSEKKDEIRLLKTLNLIEIKENHLLATEKGFLVLNQIILKLV